MRLFLALPIPKDISQGLVMALDRADMPRVRIVKRDLWHVNLAFIGDVPETDLDLIINAANQLTTCPGSITIDRLETYPTGGPRELVGLGKEDSRESWKAFIETVRGAMLPFAPQIDRSPWRPYIRVGNGPNEGVMAKWGTDIGPWNWKPEGFKLIQSVPDIDGTMYKTLHEFRFTV